MTEFQRIDLFTRPFEKAGAGVVAGPGDDCALTAPRPGRLLVSKVDELVEGVHFGPAFRPEEIGHKALAVALSDLAAAGSIPRWFLVALALPARIDDRLLARVARGMAALASRSGVILVGGNLTRAGALSLTVTTLGEVRPEEALRRSGAEAGDELWVTGTLGDAALGLRLLAAGRPKRPTGAVRAQLAPEPRLAIGAVAGRYASAAIDLSDGLLQDLGHLCERSGVGAEVDAVALPLSKELRRRAGDDALGLALAGGEDYELLFTVPKARVAGLRRAAGRAGVPFTRIGRIVAGGGIRVLGPGGTELPLPARRGWDPWSGA